MRIDEGHRRQAARFREGDEAALGIVVADDVPRIEGVPLEKAQEGVEVLEVDPGDLARAQKIEDRVREHRTERARVRILPRAPRIDVRPSGELVEAEIPEP